jgi:hypothetical protein
MHCLDRLWFLWRRSFEGMPHPIAHPRTTGMRHNRSGIPNILSFVRAYDGVPSDAAHSRGTVSDREFTVVLHQPTSAALVGRRVASHRPRRRTIATTQQHESMCSATHIDVLLSALLRKRSCDCAEPPPPRHRAARGSHSRVIEACGARRVAASKLIFAIHTVSQSIVSTPHIGRPRSRLLLIPSSAPPSRSSRRPRHRRRHGFVR